MNENSTRIHSSGRFPRILIADNNFSAFEPLIDTIGRDTRLDFDFDLSPSRNNALRKLLGPPYQVIISGVRLAEMDDFLLLKQTHALQTYVPLVVTAAASEKDAAHQALVNGAFDLITIPLQYEPMVDTLRLALWQSQLMNLIAHKEKTVEQFDKFRQVLDAYPGNREGNEAFEKARVSMDQTVSAFEVTIQRVEESIKCLANLAQVTARQAQKLAFDRLDGLSPT
jgi:DNA-binding NtrC family response regulator